MSSTAAAAAATDRPPTVGAQQAHAMPPPPPPGGSTPSQPTTSPIRGAGAMQPPSLNAALGRAGLDPSEVANILGTGRFGGVGDAVASPRDADEDEDDFLDMERRRRRGRAAVHSGSGAGTGTGGVEGSRGSATRPSNVWRGGSIDGPPRARDRMIGPWSADDDEVMPMSRGGRGSLHAVVVLSWCAWLGFHAGVPLGNRRAVWDGWPARHDDRGSGKASGAHRHGFYRGTGRRGATAQALCR